MRRPTVAQTLALITLTTTAACSSKPTAAAMSPAARPTDLAADTELQRLVTMMQGSFASTAQAARDPDNYMDIRLHMARIWPTRTDGVWLYVEQATAAAQDKPYRQRVYRVARDNTPGEPGFISEVYEFKGGIPAALAYAGAFNQGPARTALDALTPDNLTKKEGCTVHLAQTPEGDYAGGTRGENCLSSLRGATYATSEVLITPNLANHGGSALNINAPGLRTWDRGFDAQGKQVWGAEKGGYFFARVTN